jgi:hypothetical protein
MCGSFTDRGKLLQYMINKRLLHLQLLLRMLQQLVLLVLQLLLLRMLRHQG